MSNLVTRLSGIITVLNTPFTDSDQIDTKSLERNIELAIKAGVSGFLVPAMASEVGKLTGEERTLLARTTVDKVAGRVAVIGGASASNDEERIFHARTLIDCGCDGVLANIPYINNDHYTQRVQALAELSPGFLMLQDWDFDGYGLPVDLIIHLFNTIDSFRSIKIEVVPAGVKYSEVLEATNGQLHIAGGWAVMQMIEAFDRGVHTIMPTGMHRIYTRIYQLYMSNQYTEAKQLFYKLLPVLAFSNQHLDISIHFFKRLLHQQGVYKTSRVRSPILPFDDIHARLADDLIAYTMELMALVEMSIGE